MASEIMFYGMVKRGTQLVNDHGSRQVNRRLQLIVHTEYDNLDAIPLYSCLV